MNRVTHLVAVVAGLVLLLSITPSWAQAPSCAVPGCNSTKSDTHDNTAGGSDALLNVDETDSGGFNNTAFGSIALMVNTTGDENTATGASTLWHNTTGFQNTAIGFQALASNISGNGNTACGTNALLENTTGANNTATGLNALIGNTTGANNTASGADALNSNGTGTNNTATGAQALVFNDTGNLNTASGFQALFSNIDGLSNTAVGAKALKKSLGTKNIGIGYQAGVSLINGNNNIYIGSAGNGDESQTIRVGTAQTSTFIAGIATTPIVENSATVEIDTATGQLGVAGGSSARFKRDIEAMGSRSEKVLELRPVTFAYRDDTHGVTHYGLVAEEVEKVYPELVTHTATGEAQTVRYQELIPMLLNELQRQRQELRDQRQELAELRALVGQGRGAEAAIPSPTVAASGTDSVPQ